MSRVSVIIPVYNAAPYLPQCLTSVLAQTLKELEVICVDDGSTDGSAAVLADYAKRDARIRVITQSNAGAGAARNVALLQAQGEFVAWMDADDRYASNTALEELYRAATASGTKAAAGNLVFELPDGSRVPADDEFARFSQAGAVDYREVQVDYGFQACLFSRSLLQSAGIMFPVGNSPYEDPLFMVQALVAAGRMATVPVTIYVYRVAVHELDWRRDDCRNARGLFLKLQAEFELAGRLGLDCLRRRLCDRCEDQFLKPFLALLEHCPDVRDEVLAFCDRVCEASGRRRDLLPLVVWRWRRRFGEWIPPDAFRLAWRWRHKGIVDVWRKLRGRLARGGRR